MLLCDRNVNIFSESNFHMFRSSMLRTLKPSRLANRSSDCGNLKFVFLEISRLNSRITGIIKKLHKLAKCGLIKNRGCVWMLLV